MSDTGWVSPGTVKQEQGAAGTKLTWSDIDNVKASDNSRASVSVQDYSTKYLCCYNFDFDIPSGSTIDGIEFAVEGYTTATSFGFPGASKDTSLNIWLEDVDGGDLPFADRKTLDPALKNGSSNETVLTAGSSTDKWGSTWGASDFDTSFTVSIEGGGEFSGDAYIDHIKIKVYYTESSGTGASSERGLYIEGSPNLSDYYDENYLISCRVYQEVT